MDNPNDLGQPPVKSRWWRVAGGVLAVLCASAPAIALLGFTVDDAFIVGRVAAHISQGHGHRFNLEGPLVDAVTPLGLAHLVAFVASPEGPLQAVQTLRLMGLIGWLTAAGWLGMQLGPHGWRALRVIVPLACCAPLAAWSSAGLETGLVLLLTTLALHQGWLGPVCAGAAAGWRPELLPWTAALWGGRALFFGSSRHRVATAVLSFGPAVLVAALRFISFGHLLPLSSIAKPADLDHGLFYAAQALFWTGPVWLLLSRRLRELDSNARSIVLAVAAHSAALVVAGGDWMALFRLAAPMLPGCLLVGGMLAAGPGMGPWIRLLLASTTGLWLMLNQAERAREVLRYRLELIEAAKPVLVGCDVTAALDIGWLGAATNATIVDVAGVTDEKIARLPGGHTSKRLPPHFVQQRGVDCVVVLATGPVQEPWWTTTLWRHVDRQVASQARDEKFQVRAALPVGGTSWNYLVLEHPRRAEQP